MRHKRAKIANHKKEVDQFYKTLTNAKSKNRGSELIIIMPRAMTQIFKVAERFSCSEYRNRPSVELDKGLFSELPGLQLNPQVGCSFSYIFWRIYRGERFKDLKVQYPSHLLTAMIRKAIAHLGYWDGIYTRVTLRTIYTSGRMIRLAEDCGLDLEFECNRYGVKVLI